MKYEEYRRRLLAEKATNDNCLSYRSNIFLKCDLPAAKEKLDFLDKRLVIAEVSFYRQHWWQFWRPSKPEI
jgi:hypothetical protein